jgi:hypothetical protein
MRSLLIASIWLVSWLAAAQAGQFGRDLNGEPIGRLSQQNNGLVVLFFLASDCPISNRYSPVIMQMQRGFQPQHVDFWWVYPNASDTAEVVREHRRQFSIAGNVALDPDHSLVHLAHARATPEAAVFTVHDGQMHEVYHGRVDNRYLAFGKERPQPTQHDLQDAISATLAGRTVTPAVTPPTGCAIMLQGH